MKGGKRPIAVDSQGLLLRVGVHPANGQDKESARLVLRRLPLWSRWELLVLDGGYHSPALMDGCEKLFSIHVEIVHRMADHAFVLLPKRWVVERTFAWLGKCRRLSQDYEQLPLVSEAWV